MQALTRSDIRIEAKTERVLEKLKANRTEHMQKYLQAKAGYLEDVRVELFRASEEWAQKTIGDKTPDLYVHLSAPRKYAAEYDTAITMMEFHTEDTITLDATQVRQFLMDEWDWKAGFNESFDNYSKGAIGAAR